MVDLTRDRMVATFKVVSTIDSRDATVSVAYVAEVPARDRLGPARRPGAGGAVVHRLSRGWSLRLDGDPEVEGPSVSASRPTGSASSPKSERSQAVTPWRTIGKASSTGAAGSMQPSSPERAELRLGVEEGAEPRRLGDADDAGAVAERAEVVEAVVADCVDLPVQRRCRRRVEGGPGAPRRRATMPSSAPARKKLGPVREVGGVVGTAGGHRHVAVDPLVEGGAEDRAAAGRVPDGGHPIGVDVALERAAGGGALGRRSGRATPSSSSTDACGSRPTSPLEHVEQVAARVVGRDDDHPVRGQVRGEEARLQRGTRRTRG